MLKFFNFFKRPLFQYTSILWEEEDEENMRELAHNPRYKQIEKRIRKRIDYLTSETISGNDSIKEINELFTLISILQSYERNRD